MSRAERVRVVVGEAAPAGAGVLRSILQAEGFEVVGQASSAEQLQPVLAAADPQVIVFDADTSATTVLAARDWAPRAGIVVVWPSSVLSPGADQQVEPSRAGLDLGLAVRRAVRIHRPQSLVPAAVPDLVVFERIPDLEEPAVGVGAFAAIAGRLRSRRSDLSLALAAASIVFLVVAAFALQPTRHPISSAQPSPTPTPSGPFTPGGTGGRPGQDRSAGSGIAGVLASLVQAAGATGSASGGGPGSTQPGQPPPTTTPVLGRPSGGGSPGTGQGPSTPACNNGHHGHHGLGPHGHHGLSCRQVDAGAAARGGHGPHGGSGGGGSVGGEGDHRHSDIHHASNGTTGGGNGHANNASTARGRAHGAGRGHQS